MNTHACEGEGTQDLHEGFNDSIQFLIEQFSEEIDNYRKKEQQVCPQYKDIKDKKELVFGFEGAGGYSPKSFNFNRFLNQNNIEPHQYHRLCQRNGWSACEKIDNQIKDEFESTAPTGVEYLLKDYVGKTQHSDKEFLYYSRNGRKQAMECLLSLKEKFELNENEFPSIKITGYSWGGHEAQEMVRKLEKLGLPVKSIFTIDPVRKGVGVVKNLFTRADNKRYFAKRDNVQQQFNIYQKADRKSLKLFGIKGNRVQGADEEVRGLDMNRYGHLEIPRTIEAIDLMSSFIDY